MSANTFARSASSIRPSASRYISATAGVSIQPGAIAFTLMPSGPNSAAAVQVSEFTAALVMP